jgi:hypothetical protein
MPSQDVIPHHPCSGLANEPFLKYLKTVQKTLEACAAGKMLHNTGLRMLQIECTGMKTPILGVCDRTRMKP